MDPKDILRLVASLQAAMAAAQGQAHARGHGHGRGSFFGGGFGDNAWRWGMHGRRGRARRGDVRAAILAMLGEKPMNGYQIMQALEEKSRGTWRPSPGAIYPALQQLEDEGLIRADTTDSAGGRVFHLTAKGQKAAQQSKDDGGENPWDPPADEVDDDSDAGLALARLLPMMVQPVIAIAQGGSPAQVKAAKRVLKDAKKALYAILADDDDSDEGDAEGGA